MLNISVNGAPVNRTPSIWRSTIRQLSRIAVWSKARMTTHLHPLVRRDPEQGRFAGVWRLPCGVPFNPYLYLQDLNQEETDQSIEYSL